MDSFKKIKKYMSNCEMKFRTGGRMPYRKTYSAEKLLDIINLLEENKIYGLFKNKGAIGITAGITAEITVNDFVSKKTIRDKIKALKNEKNYYYSDWKLEELDNQIKVLKELLEE